MEASTKIVIIAAGLGVTAYLLYRAAPQVAKGVGGIFSGNNALTRGATNAAGQSVTAYQDAGVLGTLGAGANAVSGGWFASLGEWVGGKAADAADWMTPGIGDGIRPQNAANATGMDLTNGAAATIPLGQIISVGM